MRKYLFVLVVILVFLLGSIFLKFNNNIFLFSSYQGFVVEGDTIIKYNNFGGNVVIPSSIDGVIIKKIGDYAFSNLEIDSVTIPNSIKEIGSYAFSNNNISNLFIPDSVDIIGEGAFMHNKISSLSINSNTFLSNACFNDNLMETNSFFYSSSNMNEVISYGGKVKGNIVLPNNIEIIGEKAFLDTGIVSIEIPSTISTIKSNAFSGNNLVELYIPNTVKDISSDAFSNNDYLMEIFVDNNSSSIINSPWGAEFSNVFWTKK